MAGIVHEGQFIVKEDVSRHVAVDKVIGYGLLHDFDLSQSYVIYSGRMPLAGNEIKWLMADIDRNGKVDVADRDLLVAELMK